MCVLGVMDVFLVLDIGIFRVFMDENGECFILVDVELWVEYWCLWWFYVVMYLWYVFGI